MGYGTIDKWNDFSFINGCFDNTNTTENSAWSLPAGNYTFEWQVIRPSGTTTGTDYFTVTEGDTTTYILEY
jgi:methionine-rich copper-binding protein CopC